MFIFLCEKLGKALSQKLLEIRLLALFSVCVCMLGLQLLKHSQRPKMKEAVMFGLMNAAKMELSVISKSTSTTARRPSLEKEVVLLGKRLCCLRYVFQVVPWFSIYAFVPVECPQMCVEVIQHCWAQCGLVKGLFTPCMFYSHPA